MSSQQPVCRFFSSGGCYRSDCKFSHQAQTTTCRFWALGECAKGDACKFRHAYDDPASPPTHSSSSSSPSPSSSSSRSSPAMGDFTSPFAPGPASPVIPPSPLAFLPESTDTRNLFMEDPMIPDHHRLPAAAAAVSVSAGSSAIPQPRIPAHMPLSIAERLKLKQLTEKYSLLPASSIEEIFICTANRNSSTTEEILLKMYPHLRTAPTASSSSSAASSSPAAVTPPLHRTTPSKPRAKQIKWVETGEGLNQTYMALREEAIRHAQLRNSYFDQSQTAYNAGNKSRATELARLARSHDEQMVAIHRQAADFIFEKRNAG